MRLLIIRHGDPDYSLDSLTTKGWREATLLAERIAKLDVKSFYCSPLGRAKDTASRTLQKMGRTAEVFDWLREFDAGAVHPVTGEEKRNVWDLMPSYWTNIPAFYDRKGWLETDFMKSGQAKERYREVAEGLDSVLARHGYVREGNFYRAESPNRDTLVLFCHFGVTCVMLGHLLGISPAVLWHGFVAAPTSVTQLYTEEREQGVASFRCQMFGDVSHLYAGGEPPAFAARFCETYDCFEERH